MDYRSIIFVLCLICSTIASDEQIDNFKMNPIINLFEGPLHTFKTEPGEAIAVFEPQLVRQANNDTNGISSWFQAGQNIGSAAGALTGWIRNRISSPTTTNPPEVIVQVHQVERPKPSDNMPTIQLGPNNNIAKRKKQQPNPLDEINDEMEAEFNGNNNNNNDDEDDEEDDGGYDNNSNEDDENINHNRLRRNRNRNQINQGNRIRGGSSNRNFNNRNNNNFRYDYEDEDEDDSEEYDDDDDEDSYRDGYDSDNDDDDDDDDDIYYVQEYDGNSINRRRQPIANNINYRPVGNRNRPPVRHQTEFYRPIQDMSPLPVRYGGSSSVSNSFQAVGVLKQQQRRRQIQLQQQLQQQQFQQQQLQQQQFQQQKLQKKKLQQQKLEQEQQEQEQNNQNQNHQHQNQHQNRPHVDLLLNGQNHVLIPVQVVPNSIPYQQILPQIQVVAQHHHTIEQQPTEEPATVKPNRRTKRPNKRRPNQNFDGDRRPGKRTTTTRRPTTTSRRPRPTRTTRTTTSTTMSSKFPEKGNKFEINRRKPVVSRSETPTSPQPDQNRPDAMPQVAEDDSSEELPLSIYQPPVPVMDIYRMDAGKVGDEKVEEKVEEENFNAQDNDGNADKIESKSGEARAQYHLPQRYFKILGSNSYLALNNNGRFLLRTGRKADTDTKDVVNLASVNDNLKVGETTKEEKNVSSEELLVKPVENDSSKSDAKIEIDESKLPITQIKITEQNSEKIITIDPKIELKSEPESISLEVTTESPLKVEKENPIIELVVPVETVVKPVEKIVLKSEVVQEKQNGDFIIKSENAATLPKVDKLSSEKGTQTVILDKEPR